MNVTVENLGPCKKLMRIEVPPNEVEEAFVKVEKDFQRHAALPGFRPGKAPRDMILKRYEKEIEEEAKKQLISDSYRKAVKEQKLEVISPELEEVQFARNQPLQVVARLETAPEFELPAYRGLPAKRETSIVSEADIDRALEMLRERQSHFHTLDREVREGDYVVVNYTGTAEGQPIAELAPTAKGLGQQKNFWIEVLPDSFIPGFATQLLGAKAGEKRTVKVTYPAEFVNPQLAGKEGVYEVEVVEVKEKHLPPIDDEFARAYGAEDLPRLREGVRADLQNELNSKQSRTIRGQVTKALLSQVQCDLPESVVNEETRSVVFELVRENQERGISKETIEQQKDAIYSGAASVARERVKAAFVFQRIAEKEGIRVSREEANLRIYALAKNYDMAPEKFVKELEKRNGVQEIFAQLLNEKVLDFLQQHARIEDVAPAPQPAEEPGQSS